MYSYSFDVETGGLLLNLKPCTFSKEPRPVYSQEMDLLGMDKYFDYAPDNETPYLFAENTDYYYYGEKIASIKGGSLNCKPELIIQENLKNKKTLKPINIFRMVEKNKEILTALVHDTIRKIYSTFLEYRKKIDVFYVAFSGGKDSVVTLDLVKRALPHDSFKVVFGDTMMEFPDTYEVIEKIKSLCKNENIDFITSKSHFKPSESWNLFGPPATVNRWCCSVHKTAPQILALRKLTNKNNFTGMAFIGVRASESINRSRYEYLSRGEKHKGQYSCNPILEWNSAELFIYMYAENLIFNETYKNGNKRAGCLVCPMATDSSMYFRKARYSKEVDEFQHIIYDLYKEQISSKTIDDFMENCGWKARKNGRDISIHLGYKEFVDENVGKIFIEEEKTPWKIWIKTIGVLKNSSSPYLIDFKGNLYQFVVKEKGNSLFVEYENSLSRESPSFIKLLKNVFRKSACCCKCRECEADCLRGCISMENGKLIISDDCIHCSSCHKVDKGCLIYKSLELPRGNIMEKKESLNRYSTHGPKMDWIKSFLTKKEEFFVDHDLGSEMFPNFKKFLKDAKLIDIKKTKIDLLPLVNVIEKLSLEDECSWALMLVNLAHSPQINWFVLNCLINESYTQEYILSLLESNVKNSRNAKDVYRSFTRFIDLGFKNVGLGEGLKNDKDKVIQIKRTPWIDLNDKVLLYSLFRFAEECEEYFQFTLSDLCNLNIERKGVTPVAIFGVNKEQLKPILQGLSVNYPDFISVSFTHDLESIALNSEKKCEDVLGLF